MAADAFAPGIVVRAATNGTPTIMANALVIKDHRVSLIVGGG
jgi:hypothetical protein